MNWMSARAGSQQPRAMRSEHLPPIPDSQGTGRSKRGGTRAQGLELVPQDCSTHPPFQLRLLIPHHLFFSLLLLSVLPSASSQTFISTSLSALPLARSLAPQGPLLPFCFSSSRTRLSCTLSLEKRGGELGEHEHGEEPGGGNGEGTEERLPSLHWRMPAKRLRLPLLAFLLLRPLPLRTRLRCGIALQRVLGPPCLSREPSASVDRGNQKLFSCFPCCQQRQLFFFLARTLRDSCRSSILNNAQ